jgi:hypothetical protein
MNSIKIIDLITKSCYDTIMYFYNIYNEYMNYKA